MMNRHTILLSLGGTLYFDAITLINVFALTHLNFLARCSFFIIFAMAVGGSKMCYMGGASGILSSCFLDWGVGGESSQPLGGWEPGERIDPTWPRDPLLLNGDRL